MTVQMTERELAIEREQVEWVFRLTGGELEEEPWEGFARGAYALSARYWYDGAPEYVASEYPEHGDYEYRTVVWDGNLSAIPEPPEGWEEVAQFVSLGETDCPCQSMDPHDAPAQCPLCEGGGFIYLGEGWAEVVYRTHKATLWPEDYCHAHDTPRELPCEACDASGPECPLCGGETELMGRLGALQHYRCWECGADQSLRPHDDPSLQR